jgi:GPH family glycoside/pentoside/hexuronide:cation symporter
MTVSVFLMYYYTDVLRLPALAVTAILLAARFFDGAVDPLIGHYMDARTTKHGKYRGYLYYWAAPSCLLFILLFVPPPAGGSLAIAWCLAIYICWSFASSITEVAILPLMASISGKGGRSLINTLKISASILAAVAASYLTLRLVNALGRGSEQFGFLAAVSIFACVSAVSILLGAVNIREREQYAKNSMPFFDSVLSVLTKKPLIFMYLAMLCGEMCGVARNQGAIYYLKYCLNRADAIPLLLLAHVSGALLAQPFILKASGHIRASRLMIAGFLAAAAASSLIWLAESSVPLLLTANFMFGVFLALPANLVYVYAAKLADDLSCRNNGSFCGIVNSLLGIAAKLGYAAAGTVIALALHFTSYEPNAAQGHAALFGIQICFTALPSAAALLGAFFASISFLGAARERTLASSPRRQGQTKPAVR